jgi:hypothetical protein
VGRKSSRRRVWPKRLLSVMLAGMLGVGIGEVAAAKRDRGGFPHFNGYRFDRTLGVRLQPNFDTAIAFLKNPVGKIHVNAQGFRGQDWPSDRTGEVVTIGDSQVFGLGVDDDQTASSVLSALMKKPVINMGVPTYGPDEYLAMIDEAGKRKPTDVVVVLNFGNDIFEIGHPNRDRHVVLDGWAVRGGKVRKHMDFPGRSWLLGRSHLVYAVRQLIHPQPKISPVGSDGPRLPVASVTVASTTVVSTTDASITVASSAVPSTILASSVSPAQSRSESSAMGSSGAADGESPLVAQAMANLDDAEREVYQEAYKRAPDVVLDGEWSAAMRAAKEGAKIGDIYYQTEAAVEAAVPIRITAGWLRAANEFRNSGPVKLKEWANEHAGTAPGKRALRVLAKWEEAKAAFEATTGFVASDRPASAFRSFIAEAKRRAGVYGAELTVVGLPLDVQVDANQFKKYGEEPKDLSSTLALLDDLCADSTMLGARCLNATSALKASGEGTFLDGDLHLTAKGQKAFGETIAKTLADPVPQPVPLFVPGPGRTRFPSLGEFKEGAKVELSTMAKDRTMTRVPLIDPSNQGKANGEVPKDCSSRSLREYIAIECVAWNERSELARAEADEGVYRIPLQNPVDNLPVRGSRYPIGVRIIDGPLDRKAWFGPSSTGFIVPRDATQTIVADFFWLDGGVDRLTIPPTTVTDAMNIGTIGSWTPGPNVAPPNTPETRPSA